MIEWVVEKLIELIPSFKKASSLRQKMQDNALRATSHALNETFLYYRDIYVPSISKKIPVCG